MTEQEKKSILDIVLGNITKEKFFEMFPAYADNLYILQKYRQAIRTKNKEEVNYLGMVPVENEKVLLPVYRELITLDWHYESEDMAGYFQLEGFDDAANMAFLEKAMTIVPVYLKEGEMRYPFYRKVIYAMGAQPTPYNIEALEKLVLETTDPQIKDLALHQLEKRKKLGRWEAANQG